MHTIPPPPAPGHSDPPPAVAACLHATLAPAGPGLYRVRVRGGRVVGHVAVRDHPLGARYEALRYQVALAAFRSLGDFWSADDAVAALLAG